MPRIGIYKWTSPTNRVYVGQSKDLDDRKKWYDSGGIKRASMPKLKRSFNKYGIENHKYDIIEHCSIEQLDEREIYWGTHYNTLKQGLNCRLGNQNSIFSESTKLKMSRANKKHKRTPEHEYNRQIALQKTWAGMRKENPPKIHYKKRTDPHTPETKKLISERTKGIKKHTKEFKNRLSELGKKRDMSKCKKKGKPILQYTLDGEFVKEWKNSSLATQALGGKKYDDNIRSCIRGERKSSMGFIWRSKE